MIRANQYWFYDLGSKLHPLSKLSEDATYGEVFLELWTVRGVLDDTYKIFPLRLSRSVAEKLYFAIGKIVPATLDEALEVDRANVIGYAATQVRQAVEQFEIILAAELQLLDTYLVSQKGTYSTPDLIDRGELMIPDGLRQDVPEQAIIDLREAGRCLAFNVSTAAAFHSLRATESVIRLYYELVTGKKPKPKMRNWGAYVKNLNEAGANPKVTGFIDHLRDLYRNPVLHAEDNVNPDDSMVFLGACVSLMCKTMMEIQAIKRTSKVNTDQATEVVQIENTSIELPREVASIQ